MTEPKAFIGFVILILAAMFETGGGIILTVAAGAVT